MFVAHRPAGALAPHVEMIWYSSRNASPHSRERSLPTGRADIVIPLLQDSVVRFDSVDAAAPRHLRGAVVSGAHDRFVVRGVSEPSEVIGVHFRPGGAAAFFDGALAELHNRTELLDAVWGPTARDLRERLQSTARWPEQIRIVEDALLARLREPVPADAMVSHALRAIARDPSAARIDVVRGASGCSPQQFIRRFDAMVGITPKRYARVLRFTSMLSRIVRVGPRDWADVALEGGYFDQSHLIHEFRRLAGVTPAAYVPLHASQPTHVPIEAGTVTAAARKNLQSPGGRAR